METVARIDAARRRLAAQGHRRATLLPGLDLHVRADAGLVVYRMAREIIAAYRAC